MPVLPPRLAALPPPSSSPPLASSSPPVPSLLRNIRDTAPPPPPAMAPRAGSSSSSGFVAIPATYGSLHNSMAPGTIAGIVLGSIAGFLLLLFLLYSCLGFGIPLGSLPWARGGGGVVPVAVVDIEEDDVSVRRGRSGKRKHRKRAPRAAETYEVRTRERIVQEQPFVDARPRQPQPRQQSQQPPPPRNAPRRVPPSDDEDDEEDEVIVYEEEEEEPRRKSRRPSGRPSDDRRRRDSGYRDVDPGRYGDRDGPRRSSSRRDR